MKATTLFPERVYGSARADLKPGISTSGLLGSRLDKRQIKLEDKR